jgi:hypothetical protein
MILLEKPFSKRNESFSAPNYSHQKSKEGIPLHNSASCRDNEMKKSNIKSELVVCTHLKPVCKLTRVSTRLQQR